MTQKFVISTEESYVELEYDDVQTKKLVGICESKPIKSLIHAAIVVWIITGIVFVYDYFKDIGRNFSATKDLFNGKQGSFSKYVGFTKGNITRYLVTIGLFILGGILFYLSDAMGEKICVGNDRTLLQHAEKIIKYNDKGIPIGVDIPKKK
jgi:hypothetical protein